ncbi:hypothetical protein [Paenibacillus odorifer]|jgi:hypothetical protein|uniref:hypothetical protein n=1 Tax=Paenibacillus odorifer TaxID=189426 RepID=UPI00096C723C|nr:hypothetical protein [Paenibacillus odorifer]OMD57163.1 hypothetical protein BSK55_19045 [Paenibacillus odorifer]
MYKFLWRITKYNPANRINNVYTKNEWTSISDVGNLYPSGDFLIENYLETESLYITAINLIMNENNLYTIQVVDLEKYNFDVEKAEFHSIYTDEMKSIYNSVKNGDYISVYELKLLSQLILREKIWCKFQSREMFVHFGFDYYMYIGSVKECNDSLIKISSSGLFVESFETPYLQE